MQACIIARRRQHRQSACGLIERARKAHQNNPDNHHTSGDVGRQRQPNAFPRTGPRPMHPGDCQGWNAPMFRPDATSTAPGILRAQLHDITIAAAGTLATRQKPPRKARNRDGIANRSVLREGTKLRPVIFARRRENHRQGRRRTDTFRPSFGHGDIPTAKMHRRASTRLPPPADRPGLRFASAQGR